MRWCCGASSIAPAGPPTLTAKQLARKKKKEADTRSWQSGQGKQPWKGGSGQQSWKSGQGKQPWKGGSGQQSWK